MATKQMAGEIAELHVFSELLKRGVAVYKPLVDEGLDALARLPDGQVLELKIMTAGQEQPPRRFQTLDYRPKPEFFILCADFSEDETPKVWVFPSMVFYAYSTGVRGKHKARCLDLDSGEEKYDVPLWEYLCGFRNRWELITDFAEYRKLMTSPEGFEDLEDILTAREAFEQPDEEKVPWEEYARLTTPWRPTTSAASSLWSREPASRAGLTKRR